MHPELSLTSSPAHTLDRRHRRQWSERDAAGHATSTSEKAAYCAIALITLIHHTHMSSAAMEDADDGAMIGKVRSGARAGAAFQVVAAPFDLSFTVGARARPTSAVHCGGGPAVAPFRAAERRAEADVVDVVRGRRCGMEAPRAASLTPASDCTRSCLTRSFSACAPLLCILSLFPLASPLKRPLLLSPLPLPSCRSTTPPRCTATHSSPRRAKSTPHFQPHPTPLPPLPSPLSHSSPRLTPSPPHSPLPSPFSPTPPPLRPCLVRAL